MDIEKPDMPGFEEYSIVYGANQPEYLPLPAVKLPNGDVITRWKPSEHERARIARGEDVYLQVKTFGDSLQPQLVTVGPPVNQVPVKPTVFDFGVRADADGVLLCAACSDGKPLFDPPNAAATIGHNYTDLAAIQFACVAHTRERHDVSDAIVFTQNVQKPGNWLIIGIASRSEAEAFLGRKLNVIDVPPAAPAAAEPPPAADDSIDPGKVN